VAVFVYECKRLCSPLRSCPERPGPQVVLCLGMRSEVRNGVCLCSSRYARSSRWAELVAVSLNVCNRKRGGAGYFRGRRRTKILLSVRFQTSCKQTYITHTHKRKWEKFMQVSQGSCQAPTLTFVNSFRKAGASTTWFCPQIPSSLCLSRGTEADAIRPLSGLISSADKCLIHRESAV